MAEFKSEVDEISDHVARIDINILTTDDFRTRLGLSYDCYVELSHTCTPNEAYGEDIGFGGRIGRGSELGKLWQIVNKQIRKSSLPKNPVYYIHASPGMGKTYLLRSMVGKGKNGVDRELYGTIDDAFLMPVDFNRNCCSGIKELLNNRRALPAGLLPIARAYYVLFCNQKVIGWTTFFEALLQAMGVDNMMGGATMDTMISHIKDKAEQRPIIALVDELQKTEAIGPSYPDQYRSAICSWADLESRFCKVVIFSSLSRGLMKNEVTTSNRPVLSATTIPLWSKDETVSLLRQGISADSWKFVDENSVAISGDLALELLAVASGGHPRSVQFIVEECKTVQDSQKHHLMELITAAGQSLLGAYKTPPSWLDLIQVALLARPVKLTDTIGDAGNKETFESLVNRGLLVHSFGDNDEQFVPVMPEIFLFSWCASPSTNDQIRQIKRCLSSVLLQRRGFTRKKWEVLHSDWQCLMRYGRSSEYERYPLNGLYNFSLSKDLQRNNLTIQIVVDGKTPL